MLNSQLNDRQILNGRYLIKSQLGKKADKTTFKAIDRNTNKFVVIKTLLFGSQLKWHDFKLFKREAETLKSLSHRAIPKYLDYFELELNNTSGFALVQNYIAARSLQEYLRSGRSFSESEVIEIGKQILEILIYLHSRQPAVVHRDIKPSNILLGDRTAHSVGKIYLVDFGSVYTAAASRKGTTTIVGTYGYMPPEQYRGRVTPKSDIYSLGATLIYLITGEHPSDLPQTDDLSIEFEAAANISNRFSNWLKKAIAPIPNQRFNSARSSLIALDNNPDRRGKQNYSNRIINRSILNKNPNFDKSRVKKALNSRSIVNRSKDSLEVTIPAIGSAAKKENFLDRFKNNLIFRSLSLFASSWYVLFLLILLLSGETLLFSTGFLGLIIAGAIFYRERKKSLRSQKAGIKKRFFLNQEKIYCYLEKNQKIQHLIKVDTPKNISKLILGKKIVQNSKTIETIYFLSIRTSNHKNYELFNSLGEFALSINELEWLAKEIGKILGIETSKIKISEIDI